jgi:hypothetical protein
MSAVERVIYDWEAEPRKVGAYLVAETFSKS